MSENSPRRMQSTSESSYAIERSLSIREKRKSWKEIQEREGGGEGKDKEKVLHRKILTSRVIGGKTNLAKRASLAATTGSCSSTSYTKSSSSRSSGSPAIIPATPSLQSLLVFGVIQSQLPLRVTQPKYVQYVSIAVQALRFQAVRVIQAAPVSKQVRDGREEGSRVPRRQDALTRKLAFIIEKKISLQWWQRL